MASPKLLYSMTAFQEGGRGQGEKDKIFVNSAFLNQGNMKLYSADIHF
jgi:hypothetical protein